MANIEMRIQRFRLDYSINLLFYSKKAISKNLSPSRHLNESW